jgi:hypothetical protein
MLHSPNPEKKVRIAVRKATRLIMINSMSCLQKKQQNSGNVHPLSPLSAYSSG